jgi:transglutaminase/protease-like cytokinesis protein 3
MKKIGLLILILFAIQCDSFGQQEAITNNGRKVILRTDGSWVYADSSVSNELPNPTSVQCNGLTKKGEKCKRQTLNASGFCYSHETQKGSQPQTPSSKTSTPKTKTSVQCSGTTKAGNRCKRMTLNASGRCPQH